MEVEHYQSPDLDQVVKKRQELEVAMETEWSHIGRSSVNPPGQQ
jgi:hypothetical protein